MIFNENLYRKAIVFECWRAGGQGFENQMIFNENLYFIIKAAFQGDFQNRGRIACESYCRLQKHFQVKILCSNCNMLKISFTLMLAVGSPHAISRRCKTESKSAGSDRSHQQN